MCDDDEKRRELKQKSGESYVMDVVTQVRGTEKEREEK